MRKMGMHLSDVEIQEIMEELDLIHTDKSLGSRSNTSAGDGGDGESLDQVNISSVSQAVFTGPLPHHTPHSLSNFVLCRA